ncbi:TLDc domain [Arabidopsis thaliana x Arabidopsis arenosa]|uniref:TLDc domain n=1 Tax=Arabidopsis thaliana x Arabidopsis arenosa TaxID=1240361 RepID=A0A8T1YD77_9BRAS|nr:TLDc domain [Arabidopsis thaliana x Arabidopsis arenosa]
MGASSSTDNKESSEKREIESLAASTGALPLLQRSFSKLVDSQTNTVPFQSFKQSFGLSYDSITTEGGQKVGDLFPRLLEHLGSSLVDLFFVPDKEGLSWVEFARGYVKCCGRMSASMSFNTLLRIYYVTAKNAGFSPKLEFESDEADCKINGSISIRELLVFLWICWTMSWDGRSSKAAEMKGCLFLPDISHLILSAVVSCIDSESGKSLDVWETDVSGLELELPIGKFLTWAFMTVPSLTECLSHFCNSRLQNLTSVEDGSGPSKSTAVDDSASKTSENTLLTCGRAWAISLTSKSILSEEILSSCFPCNSNETNEHLLYRSYHHGKGMNRLWSNVEGYHAPILVIISANCEVEHEGTSSERKWVIGAILQHGFENRDAFYGSSGNLFSISPVFHAFSSSGKEKNFAYSHLHPSGGVYDAHPKPVGIGFGGTLGNERIFIDEDFAKITVRHHAVDKTYQSGSLFPNQGYLPVEALVLDIEAWGLGGNKAREIQQAYQKREELFTNQRRKIDLKTFTNWEDSPEKMMMDMMGNPNAPRKEDR